MRLLAPLLLALSLAGCALPGLSTAPPAGEDLAARKAKAADLTRKGDLAGALIEWRILELLSGHESESLGQRQKLEAEIARLSKARFEQGRAAAAKGNMKTARLNYLETLKLDPNHPGAIAALREIEVVRVRNSRPKLAEPEPRAEAETSKAE